MAESQLERRPEHVHASNVLNYGHLGTATYLENSQEWTFFRRNIAGKPDQHVDSEQQAANSVFPFRLVADHTKNVTSYTPQDCVETSDTNLSFKRFSTFLKHLPDVVPGVPQTRLDPVFSPQRVENTTIPGLNTSERLAFGSAVWLSEEGKSDGAFVPISAMAAGPNAM